MTPEERAAIADARKEEESLRLRGLGLAEKITPDEAAEALTLARKNGVPRVSVETDLQGYRSLDEMERVDSRTRDTPALRRWLAGHDDNYAVARDDVDNLAKIEMSLGERLKSETFLGPLMRGDMKEAYVSSLSSSVAIGRYTSSWAQSVAPMWERQGRGYVLEERDQAYSTYEKAVRVLALQADTDEARKARRNEILNEPVFEGFAPNLRRLRAMMGVNEPLPEMVSPAIMSLFTEVYGANSEEWRQYQFAQPREKVSALKTVLDKTNKVTEAQRQKFRELGERVRMLQPSTGDFIADAMLGGVTSAADQIPAITAGILTKSPSVAAGIMGAKVYGETVGEGIAETDLTFDQAKSRALQQMLVELGMERIAIGYEMRILGDGSSVGSKLARGMVAEQFQEQPTTVLNNYIDWQYLHPDKTLEDFVAEMPEQAAQTFWTTLVASGALQGTMIAMDHALTSADEKARRSLMSEGDKAIEDAIKAAGKSKLAQRSPEKMEEAVRAIAEDNGIDKVAVDLDGVVEALNQKGVDPGAVLEALGVDREQAEADGIRFGETQVDLAKVMAAPAVREHLTDIQPHLRSPKDDYTPAQKQKIRDNFGNEIKDRLDMIRAAAEGKAELSDREMQAADLVRQRVEGLGIFAERVANESNADVAVALNSVLAGKMGMDPVEFFEQHFSRIQMSVDGMVKEQEGANRKDLEILYQRIVGNEQTGVQMMEPSDFGVDTAGWTVKRERDVDGDEFARIYDAAGKLKWTVPFTEGKKDGDLIREVVVDTPPEYNARTGVPKPANENTDPELVAAIMEAARSMNPEDPMQVISDAADASEIGVPQALRDNRPADQRASDRWGMSKADKLEQGNDLHRAQYDTIKNIITLFEGRNISTLIHELSHWYLFKLEEFANLENAPEGIRQEWEAIRGWYEQLKADGKIQHIRDRYSVVEEDGAFVVYYKGPYDRDPQRLSNRMATREAAEATIDWREMHETWAESFEVYMQTNEAPSLALRRAFRVFNSWLTQMWNNLRTTRKAELERANLNPEIVAIFDRMLATEQQIEAASMQAKIEAETVAGQFLKQGILTQKEYERAVKRLPEIIEEVKEELRTQLMADLRREDEAWWRTERERIKADKTRSTDTSPAGRAYNWLGFGAYKGDVPVEESPGEAARADVEALYQNFGEALEGSPEYERAVAKGLDMSPQARMQRARDMGFDTDTVLYHGTATPFSEGKGIIWGSTKPDLANDYAAMRGHMNDRDRAAGKSVAENQGLVKALVARREKTFDADLMPKTVTAPEFLTTVLEQSGKNFSEAETARLRGLFDTVRKARLREESGPHYGRHDFWYEPETLFGKDGAKAITEIFDMAGFDSIKMIEDGQVTYGIRNPANIRSVNAAFDPDMADSANLLYQSAARNTLDDQIREAEQNNAEVDQEIRTVREMLNEAAACAAGVAPASVGQMVAGTAIALGAGIPMAIIATQMTPQAQAERERRMKEWNLQEHQRLMRENPEYRQRHEQYNARRQAEYDNALAEYRAARQFEQQLEAYSDIDNMPTDDRFDMNSWTEQVTGVSGEFLDDLIGHEADGDWQAEAGTSTAKGGGQFIDSTWLRMMRQHGPDLGLDAGMSRDDILALRTDRRWGTMMTAYYAMENRAELEKTLDRPVTQKDAYLAHFLGATAAAKALTMDPDANAAEAFPEAAAANQNVFYKYGNLEKPRTVAEMIQRQTKGFSAEPLMVWDYPVEIDAEPNDGRVDR